MSRINEDMVEQEALDILMELGYEILHGPDISPDGHSPMRELYSDVILTERLRDAIYRLNPDVPHIAKEDAVKKVLRTESPDLLTNNLHFHKLVTDGVTVEYRKDDKIVHDKVWLFDFKNPDNNEFVAINQFTVIENDNNRRPDIILFVNGLPLVVIELKSPVNKKATLENAYNQLKTYQSEIPSLFHFNEILMISEGIEARAGTLTSDFQRFMPWKTIAGEKDSLISMVEMEVLIRGMFNKKVLIDLIRHFIVYDDSEVSIKKKIAAYHQYHAVNKAVEATMEAARPEGDRRCGVIWHTQGSGKSLIMAFYAGKLVLEMDNPTLVVLTDRNDLDDQLFGTFTSSQNILRQEPVQAENRAHLKELLHVASGGIVFTTIQKFLPEKGADYPTLSERRNIVVIADEAHRSQYDFIDGFARHMRDALPNASFIGFTGTPLERGDKNTVAVFGNYIDIYDIEQAVEDGATVRIYYENRLVKLDLKEEEKVHIDPQFDFVTEGQETESQEKLKSKWARMEAIVGSQTRIKKVAKDLVAHFEARTTEQDGKGMIVCMSRRICIELYNEIIKIRPEWHNEDDKFGFLKVVMTGSATDPLDWQPHIRNKPRRRHLGDVFRDPNSPIKLVIVRDMWLTGFDVPSLHTMYIDKPMKGHGLMQTIARVNRVYKEKQGGLIVDYLGIATQLKEALSQYTEGGGRGEIKFDQEKAVALMMEKYEIVTGLFHGFDYQGFRKANTKEILKFMRDGSEFVMAQEDGKKRCLKYVNELSKAFALAVPHPDAMAIRDDLSFFKAVRNYIVKITSPTETQVEDVDAAIQQILSSALVSDEVLDLFQLAGLKKPDISILSDEFLMEVKDMEHKNTAAELLRRLLNDEIKTISRKNVIEARSFTDMLEKTIKKYHNRNIEAVAVIEELIELAKTMREAQKRGENLGLTEYELAFYDALGVNDSAVKVLGDAILREIAMELVKAIKSNITIDWTLRESVQAQMRVSIKKILRKYGYPPNKEKLAVQTVLEQANRVCEEWAEINS
ncbi:type I restriction endonuclease subunit R [Methanobacterium alcaliphilum]|uniref:type I restriction endonuclease subunit R n=1 Tax=Methanobacterium alcaliphilum TaxID=392018 RepID=UPI002009F577|nr:type I restriction endonuclease subunit R [Methanobacterium alcaliphilum]MCK9150495.1 type I restriction endonuclease subunit R [Methanobacterium alcaliphilum]